MRLMGNTVTVRWEESSDVDGSIVSWKGNTEVGGEYCEMSEEYYEVGEEYCEVGGEYCEVGGEF